MPAPPQRPAPEPLRVDAVRIVALGTALWFVLFVVALCLLGWLRGHDHLWWLWTALAGWLLGLLGLSVTLRRRSRLRRRRRRSR